MRDVVPMTASRSVNSNLANKCFSFGIDKCAVLGSILYASDQNSAKLIILAWYKVFQFYSDNRNYGNADILSTSERAAKYIVRN